MVLKRRLIEARGSARGRDGEPVGSRTLGQALRPGRQPATIRNVMADLEDIGLVATPHTSAGRVPTAQGYRLFVDSLLQVAPLDPGEMDRLRRGLQPAARHPGPAQQRFRAAVGGMTHFVGMVTVPKREQFAFRHIDFVPLDGQRMLVILVFTDNEVQNRIIRPRPYSASELEQTANYLNSPLRRPPLPRSARSCCAS
jgi:heat-inducible transcriptional repressor